MRLAILLLSALIAMNASGASWYVATNGVNGAAGGITTPQSLTYALSNSLIQAGDTVWIRGGTYGTGTNVIYQYTGTAGSASNNPVIIRAYNHERAIIDGGISTTKSWIWFWDLEVMNRNINRVSDSATRWPGITLLGHGDSAINCIVHDTGQPGIATWGPVQGDGGIVYGNVVWGNGIYSLDPGWNGAVRGDGFYMQNTNGARWVQDNIAFKNMTIGFKSYTEQGRANNFAYGGNVAFVNALAELNATSAGDSPVTNLWVTNNFFYSRFRTETIRFGTFPVFQTPLIHVNLQFNGNFIASEPGNIFNYMVLPYFWSETLSMTDNNFIALTTNSSYASSLAFWDVYPTNSPVITINRNNYFGGGAGFSAGSSYNDWRYLGARNTFAQIQALGFEADGHYITSLPTTNMVFLRTNRFETGRANLTVFNWLSNSTVSVDLSGIGLTNGQMFKVRDVQNYNGTPALVGIYGGIFGTTFSIPLNLTNVTPLIGNVTNFTVDPNTHTPITFNAFVITPYVGVTNIALSCSGPDIQAAIAASSYGDTVLVPPGNCPITVSILVTNQVALMAQFQGATTLQDSIINSSDLSASSIFQFPAGPFPIFPRISGFNFTNGSRATKLFDSGNIHIGSGIGLFRIDHNTFNAPQNIGIGGGDSFGVIDHNVFAPPGAFTQPIKLTHQSYGGAANGYGAWALPSWTNSYHEDLSAIYIEDNFFTNSSGAPGIGIDGFGGARWVSRHNVFDRMIDGGHGTETTAQFAGCRLKDVYNNLFIEHGDSEAGHWRSGSGVAVSNTIVNSTGSFTVRNYRMAFGGFYHYANSTNAWDLNDPVIYGTGSATAGGTLSMTDSTKSWTPNQWIGFTIRNVSSERCSIVSGNTATTVSYIPSTDSPTADTVFSPGQTYQFRKVTTVLDEVGRGQGALRVNTSPAWPNQALDPVWQWSNTLNGASVTMGNGGYYSSVVGQEIRNAVNPNWIPYTYPYPTVETPAIVITQQPQSTNVYATQTALFRITVSGTPPLTYQWKTNGVATGTNGPALSVGPCPVTWSGMSIVCSVVNAAGSATSSTATLTVLPDPVITSQPNNATVGVGAVASFSVTATGQSTLQYQWSKNGSSISGATASNYSTPATVVGDNNSQFSVLVTDNAGSLQSANATLTVISPDPVITSQPQSTNIFASQTALFRIVASGGTTLSYQWKTNNVNTGTNGPALAVGPAPVAWSGMTIICVVTDTAGSITSSTATLTVGADPVITVQPQNATTGVGLTASFSVTATGQTSLSYQWRRNGSSIAAATLSNYTTPATTGANNGDTYAVVVTDTAGSLTSANATLTVTNIVSPPDPVITAQPQSTNVFVSQSALFSLTASGASTLAYQWKTNGVATGTNGPAFSIGPCPITMDGLAVLCVVSDLGGSITSSIATLGVKPDPVITVQPANATVGVGNTASFSVTATAQSSITYQWSKNGSTIAGATHSSYVTPATVLSDNNSQFFATVTCAAGSLQSANATLTVIGPDPVITSQPQSTNIYATQSALFRLSASGATALSYQWKTNGVATGTNGPALALGPCPVTWSGMTIICRVTDTAGFVDSSIATLTVGADPVITVQPQNSSRYAGTTASFSVTATGQTTLSYQWSLNGSTVAGATQSAYITPILTTTNNGDSYFVDVTDSAGTLTSATATLTVLPAPPTPPTKIGKGHITHVKTAKIGP